MVLLRRVEALDGPARVTAFLDLRAGFGRGLMPGYTADGEPIQDERSIPLPGFPGGKPRAGNWVRKQFQLDAFGEVNPVSLRVPEPGRRCGR